MLNHTLRSVVLIPLSLSTAWISLPFKGIPSNQINYTSQGLQIRIEKSSSPLFHRLSAATTVRGIEISGSFSALPLLSSKDRPLSLGLVTAGDKKLNWLQRVFAPQWIQTLNELSEGMGFGKVHFLRMSQKGITPEPIESDYFTESPLYELNDSLSFQVSHSLAAPLEVTALWLQADGDDSQNSFSVTVDNLKLIIDTP